MASVTRKTRDSGAIGPTAKAAQTKKWHGGGIYSKILKRRIAGEPLEVFYGRVWVPEERRWRYFRLGTKIRQARRRMSEILGNPRDAQVERIHRSVKTIDFGELLDEFLASYRSRGGTRYYCGPRG